MTRRVYHKHAEESDLQGARRRKRAEDSSPPNALVSELARATAPAIWELNRRLEELLLRQERPWHRNPWITSLLGASGGLLLSHLFQPNQDKTDTSVGAPPSYRQHVADRLSRALGWGLTGGLGGLMFSNVRNQLPSYRQQREKELQTQLFHVLEPLQPLFQAIFDKGREVEKRFNLPETAHPAR